MAITLAEIKAGDIDKVSGAVIDELRENSSLLDAMVFDDTATPISGGAGGGAWTYAYDRVTTQATAATRAPGAEYTAQEAKTTRYNDDLAIFGGSYNIDRSFVGTNAWIGKVEFQQTQKRKAVIAKFSDLVINGDSGGDANAFDGLNVTLTGTDTEVEAGGGYIDLSTSALIDANWKEYLDDFDSFLDLLDGEPSYLFLAKKMIGKFRAMARRAGQYNLTTNDLGVKVERYGTIPFMDLGYKSGGASDVIANATRTIATVERTGLTDIYAVRIGLDGFHGIAPTPGTNGQNLIKAYLPDPLAPGAVKTGELEMIAGVALKATKAAGVYRNTKIA